MSLTVFKGRNNNHNIWYKQSTRIDRSKLYCKTCMERTPNENNFCEVQYEQKWKDFEYPFIKKTQQYDPFILT